jgi:Spy/CpxP family protein refolding chaperone
VSSIAAGANTPTSGKRRLVLALLVLSVAVNLCFIGGAAWIRLHSPLRWEGPEQRYQRMAAELELSPPQQAGFDRYVAAMRARAGHMRQEVAPLVGAAWEAIGGPQADAAQVMRLFDEAAEKRREFQREATTATLAFLELLTPAQRSKFIAIARERRAPWLHSHAESR